MTSVNTVDDVFSSIGLRTEADAAADAASESKSQQADFLLLMTEQIKHQNPLNPLEGKDFLAQLAQFSQVEELAKLNQAFNDLSESVVADQSLQAANLVGREALVSANAGYLEADGSLDGMAELPSPTGDLTVIIYDEIGQPVRHLNLGGQTSGQVSFSWDGMRDDGQWAGTGTYRVEALADTTEGSQGVPTLIASRVDSISMGNSGGLTVNLAGIGAVPYDAIRAIQ